LPAALRIEILEAAHPVPDARSAAAGQRMLDAVQGLGADDLVIALISGGGSALAMAPVPELAADGDEGGALAGLQAIVTALLHSGAPISAMNTVRKHLSRAHGGRLALACGAAPVLSLLISDVPGDDPAVIASGPTVADPGTGADALAVLDAHSIAVDARLRAALESGALETPKPADFAARPHDRVALVATPWQSLQAAAQVGRERGWAVHILGDALEGEARALGAMQADLALACLHGRGAFAAPCLLLSGGEATVRMPSNGQAGQGEASGGRAGEFGLGVLERLRQVVEMGGMHAPPSMIWCLAADTDGIDGVSAHAGALVAPDSLARAARQAAHGERGASLADALARHDSHGFFGWLGDLVSTGPTHTNVNDFRALLVWP
jgi:hydroxypyruvate reductase